MLDAMDVTVAVLLSVVLGALVGGGFVLLLRAADDRRRRIRDALDPKLPDGVGRLLAALDSTTIVTDPSHNVLLSSPSAAGMGLVHRGGRLDERLGVLVDRCRREGEPVNTDLEVPLGPFGSVALHLRVRVAQVSVRFFLILAEDRTEAIRVENVRRDFVANVSHELKTPIGAVTLLAEAIGEAADDEEQVRYFAERLEVEAARLKRLTNELIDLSRLQSADSLADASVVDVSEIVDLAIDQARVAADAKHIRMSVNAPSPLPVFGDASLLLMGLHNLVANAVHYSADGSPVGVGARIHEGAVEIAVTDQGIGIAEEEQQRIFERFYRVDPARSRRTGGSGLGLSIVRHVVENHGGDIRLWSRPGKGSTFTVRLPLYQGDDASEADGDVARGLDAARATDEAARH